MVFEGKGLAHNDQGQVVFTPKVLPGEKVQYQELSRKRGVIQGWPLEISDKSEKRIEPICPYFSVCGGCVFQHTSYENQIHYKMESVRESFHRIAKLSYEEIVKKEKPVYQAQKKEHYRNKTEFSFSQDEEGVHVGFHDPVCRSKVLDHESCLLHSPNAQKAFECVQTLVKDTVLDVYDLYRNRNGFLFSITFRTNIDDHVLVVVNTNNEDFHEKEKERWVASFQSALGEALHGIVQVKKDRQYTASESVVVVLFGESFLIDRVCDLSFEIGALSFFQVNRDMATVLAREVQLLASSLGWKKTVLDLCCGNGFLGMVFAHQVENVIGIEINPHSVEEGARNAIRNGISNYTFYAGDARKVLFDLKEEGVAFQGLVIDPPRGGLGRKTAKMVAKVQADSFVYVSCNPTTLARDIEYFSICGYRLKSFQCFDLFPHTYHIETIAVFEREYEYEDAKARWIASGNEWK